MEKILISLVCALMALAFIFPAAAAGEAQSATGAAESIAQNTTDNLTQNASQGQGQGPGSRKVLRAGFEGTREVNDLDVYGRKAKTGARSVFDTTQRLGSVGRFSYNTSIYKPLYNISDYSRTKPAYQAPSNLSSRPVYDIEKYSLIKAPQAIP